MDFSAKLIAPPVAALSNGADSPNSSALQPLRAQTVLIVDDNQDNLQLASFVAEQQGYRVLIASTASEAFSQLRKSVDLILLDIVLPDMDGFKILEQLRTTYRVAANVPIIAVTAMASAQERRAISAAGFSGYLPKPYAIDALEQVLKQFCLAC